LEQEPAEGARQTIERALKKTARNKPGEGTAEGGPNPEKQKDRPESQ
jgi:hypothetical protein